MSAALDARARSTARAKRWHGTARALSVALTAPLLALALGCGRAAPTAPVASPVPFATYEVDPYLLRPEPGRALVVASSASPEPPRVEYWVACPGCSLERPAPSAVRSVRMERAGRRWFARLDHLPVDDSRVVYQVRSTLGITPPESFKAGASRRARFRFAVFGGTAGRQDVHRAVVEAVRDAGVDFVIHTGNLTDAPERDSGWRSFFRIERPLLSVAPIFPLAAARDASPDDAFGRVFLTALWTDTLHYYHQDWGNLRIVAADAGVSCAGGCMQSWFVRRALEEGARRGMLLLLVVSPPPYSSAGAGPDLQVREAIAALARDYGVEAVFSGDDAQYERSKPVAGTTYFVTGGAGASERATRSRTFSDTLRATPHYVLVDAAPDRLGVRALDLAGNVLDSIVLRPVDARLDLAGQTDASRADRDESTPPSPPAPGPTPPEETPLAAGPGSGEAAPSPSAMRLTTERFRARVPDPAHLLPYDLLRLPEFAARLAITPAFPLVYWADDVALDRRVRDALTNEEGTSLLLPTLSLFGNDPIGVGARYTHADLAGHEEQLLVAASVKANGDRSLKLAYAQPVRWLDDRWFSLAAGHDADHNERFYGIGPRSSSADVRALHVEATRADLSLELAGPGAAAFGLLAKSRFGYLHRRDAPGTDPELTPQGPAGAPPGFGAARDYLELSQTLTREGRDALGRTSRGTLLELEARGTTDLGGARLTAARAEVRGTAFLPLATDRRVLVLHAGTAAVAPWNRSDEVPIQALVTLGRATTLRGYAERRFRDRTGWWSSLEYRYLIFAYGQSRTGLSSTLFFDAGQVASSYQHLAREPLRYSGGFGLRAETLAAFLLRLQVGVSPEGSQVTLSLNEAYERP